MRGARHPNFCHRVEDYFAESTAAIDIIAAEALPAIVLMGHSTGALTSVIYAKDGQRRDRVARLILNSPFLDFREPRFETRSAAALGKVFPFWPRHNAVNRWYGRSLHISDRGEWSFNPAYKPLDGFPAYFGWIRAIAAAHDRVAAGLALPQPVLVLHSDRSAGGDQWSEEFRRADLILDVDDMRRLGPHLGVNVAMKEIAGGVHDLVLSQQPARDAAIAAMLDFAS
jgi:alpha-beta hydrolase superfamily lysophospholipase